MIHFFILFPLLIILSVVVLQLARKYPGDLFFRNFRNFLILWSFCTLAIGSAETFFHGNAYVKSMALSFAVPFLYVASSFLIKIPFLLYQKKGSFVTGLVVLVIVVGVLFGLTTFLKANKLMESLGPLQGLFQHLSKNLATYRVWSTLLIFVPVGLFFFVEALKSQELQNRIRSVLVGSGLIVAGVSEYFHILAKHAAGADFYTVFGFFLVVAGLLLPFWKKVGAPAPEAT